MHLGITICFVESPKLGIGERSCILLLQFVKLSNSLSQKQDIRTIVCMHVCIYIYIWCIYIYILYIYSVHKYQAHTYKLTHISHNPCGV